MILKNIVRSCKRDVNANFSEKQGFLNSRKVSFLQEGDWLPRLKLVRYWLGKAAPCFFCYVSQKLRHCEGKKKASESKICMITGNCVY